MGQMIQMITPMGWRSVPADKAVKRWVAHGCDFFFRSPDCHPFDDMENIKTILIANRGEIAVW
jgi:hypothetical protein